MSVKVYDGSSTFNLSFISSVSSDNILQVSNYLGWSEYRDGDNLVVYSSNGINYLTVVGAYAEHNVGV